MALSSRSWPTCIISDELSGLSSCGVDILVTRLLSPESRFYPKFVNGLNEAADIMTKNLTKQFIRLRLISLAAERAAELALDHTKDCLNITALVIVSLEPFFVVSVEVIKTSPHGIFRVSLARLFEVNVRHRRVTLHKSEVRTARVCLVCAHFIHHEVLSGGVDESAELRRVSSVLVRDNATRHDVSLDAAHHMGLEPILFLIIFGRYILISDLQIAAPFNFYPTRIGVSREARRVHRKVTLDSLERQAALGDERVQISRQPIGFHVVRQRVEMRSASEVATLLRFLRSEAVRRDEKPQ